MWWTCQAAEVGLDLDPGHQLAVGLAQLLDPIFFVVAARLAVALERRRRHAALTRDLDPPLDRRRRVAGQQPDVLPGRVHPELAAGGAGDRPGEAVMVGVRVGADQQPHVLNPEAGLGQRQVERPQPARAAHPGVNQDDPVVGSDSPGVAVRHPGPGERQPQSPDPGQLAVGARGDPVFAIGHPIARQVVSPAGWMSSSAARSDWGRAWPSGSRTQGEAFAGWQRQTRGRRAAQCARRVIQAGLVAELLIQDAGAPAGRRRPQSRGRRSASPSWRPRPRAHRRSRAGRRRRSRRP